MGLMQIEPGDMLIDDYDVVDEKQDVAIITPDDSADEPDPEPLADDCMSLPRNHRLAPVGSIPNMLHTDTAMKARILPQLPDLEIEAEAVHTWNIENYRSLGRKARGPVFQCGGHPWCVTLRGPWHDAAQGGYGRLTALQEGTILSLREQRRIRIFLS